MDGHNIGGENDAAFRNLFLDIRHFRDVVSPTEENFKVSPT